MPESWEKGGEEIVSQMVGFNEAGDFIKGTYTGKKFIDSKGVNLYELKGNAGSYHRLDDNKKIIETPVKVEEGQYYNVWGGKPAIDGLFAKAKFGDVVAVQLKEQVKSKISGHNPFKVFKTLTFGVDPTYAGESSDGVEQAVAEAGL